MNEETIAQVEQYLLGELPKEERAVFEEKLQADAAFAEAVAKQRLIIQAIQNTAALDLQNKIAQLQKAHRDAAAIRKPILKAFRPTLFHYAALLAGVSLLIAWYFFQKDKAIKNPVALYTYALAEEYPVYPSVLFPQTSLERSAGLPVPDSTQLNRINEYYTSNNNAAALAALRQLPNGALPPDRLYFYEGVLLLKLDKPQEAELAFAKVKTDPSAAWNRAIALLALGDTQEAKRIFQNVAQSEPSLREKASDLLNKINHLENPR